MSREQLIARLIVLEGEKLSKNNNNSPTKSLEEELEEEELVISPTEQQQQQQQKPQVIAVDEDKSTVDEEEEEEEEETVAPTPIDTENNTQVQMQCKWKECGVMFYDLQKLISHINDTHVGSGK
ncbi:hypothetical protein ABG067_009045, partial [Albugo candida]